MGSIIRKEQVKKLKTSLNYQEQLLTQATGQESVDTEASFLIIWISLKHKKALSVVEIRKECFIESAKILYSNFPNKEKILKEISLLQLLDSTATKRCEDHGSDIFEQLITDLNEAPCFNIALDETTDVRNIAQLLVWVCFPKQSDGVFREELPLEGYTAGQSDLQSAEFTHHFPKLVCITTEQPELKDHYRPDVFLTYMTQLKERFEARFDDFCNNKVLFYFLQNPFVVPVRATSTELAQSGAATANSDSELLELQTDFDSMLRQSSGTTVTMQWLYTQGTTVALQ
ncbi:UNVERIFIED_CONTAM: hypothetical protein FKN15_059822 [Acipenser sinensis]